MSSDEGRSRKRWGYVRPIPQDPTACLGRPTRSLAVPPAEAGVLSVVTGVTAYWSMFHP